MKKNTYRFVLVALTMGVITAGALMWGWQDWGIHAKTTPNQAPIAIESPFSGTPKLPLPWSSPTPKPVPIQPPVNQEVPLVTPGAVIPPVVNPADASVRAHILMYHYVRSGVDPHKDLLGYRLSVRPEELENQVKLLKSLGYHGISMADLAAGKGDPRAVVLSFDDGYEDFYTNAYPILVREGWTATLYIITDMIGGNYLTWDQIRELKSKGFEIGSHTLNHVDLSKQSLAEQRRQIFDSKTVLELQLGSPVTTFCYPSGRFTADTAHLVQEAGYSTATTTQEGVVRAGNDPYTYKRIRMLPDMSQDQLLKLFR